MIHDARILKTRLVAIALSVSIISGYGFQCSKPDAQVVKAKEAFLEKIDLFPARKAYSVGDTIWIILTTTDKSLYDTISAQRLPASGLGFPFGLILYPKYNTPANPANSYCRFIITPGITAIYDSSQAGASIRFTVGCEAQPFYSIRLGVVLNYPGIYLLTLPDTGRLLQTCSAQVNPYPDAKLQFQYNLADCNKDVYLSIPPASRKDYPEGYSEALLNARIAYAVKVD